MIRSGWRQGRVAGSSSNSRKVILQSSSLHERYNNDGGDYPRHYNVEDIFMQLNQLKFRIRVCMCEVSLLHAWMCR